MVNVNKKELYSLIYKRIDLKQTEIGDFNFKFTSNESYLIPFEAYSNLIFYLSIHEEDKNLLFITKFLKICSIILRRNGKTTPRQIFIDIDKEYKKFLDILGTTIYRVPFSRDEGRAFQYGFKDTNDYCYIGIDNFNESKTFINLLNPDHVCNNDVYINTLTGATLDINGAINAEIEHVKKECENEDKPFNCTKLSSRIAKNFRFINNKKISKGRIVDRLYHCISSLTSVSRRFLHMDGIPFYEVDLKCCQALLLLSLIKGELGFNKNLEIDDNYIDDVLHNDIYKVIQDEAERQGITEESIFIKNKYTRETFYFDDRSNVKELFYRSLLFGNKTTKQSQIVDIFNKLYPKTHDSIVKLNKEFSLAYKLQNLEAELILNVVPQNLIDNKEDLKGYFTVHDALCLCVTDENKYIIDLVKKEIKRRLLILSNGVADNVRFGDIKDNVVFTNEEDLLDNVDFSAYDINNKFKKYKKHVEHKPHKEYEKRGTPKQSVDRMESIIKLLNNGCDKNMIMSELGLCKDVYNRYVRKIKNFR